METEQKLIKASAVKKQLDVDGKTLKKWRNDGTLPAALSVGKVTRYSKAVIDQFTATQKNN